MVRRKGPKPRVRHRPTQGPPLANERCRGWVLLVASRAKSNAPLVRKLLLDRPTRAAQDMELTPGLATLPASRAQAPHSTPTSRQLCYVPATSAPDDPQQTHDGGPRQSATSRCFSHAAALTARLPHFTFSSSDEKWRKPQARAAFRSTEDRGSISAHLAPAIDSEVQPRPRSSPERPGTREQEPR